MHPMLTHAHLASLIKANAWRDLQQFAVMRLTNGAII